MNVSLPVPGLLSVLIVGYNSPEWLARCLHSLLGDGAPTGDFEVLVIDNASSPPLSSELGDLADRVRLVTLGANVGFANAVNEAARRARGDRLVLLNPDTEVLPGALDALAAFLDADPGRGLVGGRTVDPEGHLDPRSCWAQPSLWSQFCFAALLSTLRPRSTWFNPEAMPDWARDDEREVGVVTGCLLMVDRSTWDRLGGLDPVFFMYGEDVDLSRRARGIGFRPSITPTATVVHAGGASSTSEAKTLMVLRGKVTLYRSAGTRITRPVSQGLLLTGVAVRAAVERVRRRSDGVWGTAWRRRSEWSAGWTPADRVPVQVSTSREARR